MLLILVDRYDHEIDSYDDVRPYGPFDSGEDAVKFCRKFAALHGGDFAIVDNTGKGFDFDASDDKGEDNFSEGERAAIRFTLDTLDKLGRPDNALRELAA